MTDESIKLLVFQQQLEKDIEGGVTFVGLSVTQTIHACIVAGLSKKAERLRTDFKVSDKRYGMTCESRFLDAYSSCPYPDSGGPNCTP